MKSNPIWDYSQPDFYHFSEDSILLAKHVLAFLDKKTENVRALDLCAGCGVVGIEILNKSSKVSFDFCELQSEFEVHLKKNLEVAGFEGTVIISDYVDLEGRYDLIVCNPPYFLGKKGRISENSHKARCRFFLEGDIYDLIAKMKQLLTATGSAFFLFREPLEGLNYCKRIPGGYLFELV